MVDPTSELEEDVSEEEAPACSACGDVIVREYTHSVVTWVKEGTVETRHFCSDGCRDTWDR